MIRTRDSLDFDNRKLENKIWN